MKLKQFFAVLLALCIVSCLVPLGAAAEEAEIVESGTCGDNLTWTLDSEGTLTISGEGRMENGGAFADNHNIKNLVIESGVTSIGSKAFAGCSNLETVSLADTVTVIDSNAFESTAIKEVIIPDGLTSLYFGPFMNCAQLEHVELPNTLKSFFVQSFYGCTALKEITIPASVTSLSDWEFAYSGLKNIWFNGDAPEYLAYASPENRGLLLPFEGVTATAYYPAGNATWTDEAMKALGGDITWVPYELDKDYEILDGTDNAWTSGSKDSLVVHADAEMSKLGAVKVDGETIDPVNYTVTEGSTIVTLSADYLSTLAVGEHTITLVFTDGTAETTFTVEAAQPEETEPETTIPEGTEPETTVPEESQPETTVPGETEPETTAPDDTKPGVTTDTGSEDSNPATGGNDMLYPVMLLVILSTAGLCLMTILVRRNRR